MDDRGGARLAQSFARLCGILALERLGPDRLRGDNEPDRFGRLFGGQVIAQALMAAARTVEGRLPHSLHAYFLQTGAGGPDAPRRRAAAHRLVSRYLGPPRVRASISA
jgi:hypothetical protein